MYRLLQSLLALALLFTFAVSAPTQPKKRSFKVGRIRQRDFVPDGTIAIRKAYNKFGLKGFGIIPELDISTTLIPVSELAASNSPGTDNGQVAATSSQNDAEFLSPVTIGGQTLVMNFDTGSSDMWVFNTQLPASSQTGHTIYDPSKSTTFAPSAGSTFNITYGDGSFATGPVGTDTVDIGGATVPSQAIGLPTQVASSFVSDTASNGLVGLAFSKLNTIRPSQQQTFFDNVAPLLSSSVFTANLKHGTAGGYEFGTVDTTQFSGSLTTVPINARSGFWEFTSTQIAVGNGSAQTVTGGSGIAIADTGTSLMIVDQAVVSAYWSQVAGAINSAQTGGVIFPCGSALPDFSVAIGSTYMAKISGSLLNFASAGTDSQTGQAFCFGAIQSNGGAKLQIYGDIFFKSQFVAFDSAGPSIGVAPHV